MDTCRPETKPHAAVRSNIGAAMAHAAPSELSLPQVYLLRAAYLIIAAGLGFYVWPNVIHHASGVAATGGIRLSLLAGLGAMAALGLRFPVQMLPLLLFELSWKAIYLVAFALPLWASNQMTAAVQEDVNSILAVVVLLPLIPWRYVFSHYVAKRGDRWS